MVNWCLDLSVWKCNYQLKPSDHGSSILCLLLVVPILLHNCLIIINNICKFINKYSSGYWLASVTNEAMRSIPVSCWEKVLAMPFARTVARQNCTFSVVGPRVWIGLPQELRLSPKSSPDTFYGNLKTFGTDGCWKCFWVVTLKGHYIK